MRLLHNKWSLILSCLLGLMIFAGCGSNGYAIDNNEMVESVTGELVAETESEVNKESKTDQDIAKVIDKDPQIEELKDDFEAEESDEMAGELIKDTEELIDEVAALDDKDINLNSVSSVLCPSVVSDKRNDVAYGNVTHFEYFSNTTNCNRGANILLPADYDDSKEYEVLYFLHGIFGDENSMLGDPNNKIVEIIGNLKADEMINDIIIVFPNMYATGDPNLEPGFKDEQIAPYDNFINDLVDDLIPYIESNYPVRTDREGRNLIGFSMGGRESLYIGVMRPDLFNTVGAIAPAPGLTPSKDWAMTHPGQMSEDELLISDEKAPKLVMVCCGTKDSVVGKFPSKYHEILDINNTKHLWYEVPDADHDSNAIRSGLYNLLIRINK